MRDRTFLGLVAGAAILLALLIFALPAGAHSDGGVDEEWVPAMNQESYWEDRFGAECTKYENHNGFIPAEYEIAISKGGTLVRVYNPAPDNDFIVGPGFEDNQGRHRHRDISWVMKCNVEQVTTTTTVPETTTTTEEVTTTTVPEETTTTEQVTTTTVPEETTTTQVGTTTTVPEATTTVPEATTTTAGELPFTGPEHVAGAILLGLGLLGIGVIVIYSLAHTEEDI